MSPAPLEPTEAERRAGMLAAAGAFFIWGILPLYIKLVSFADARELLGVRILMSIPASLIAALAISGPRRGLAELAALFRPRTVAALTVSALFIFLNWATYIWVVLQGRVIEASLAYFLSPLVTVGLGVAFFGERLTRTQLAALAFAGGGVVLQGVALGAPPYASLAICATWCVYALLRKRIAVPAAPGMFVESVVLAAPAAALLLWAGAGAQLAFTQSVGNALLLTLAGPATAAPLILFAFGARRVAFTSIGLLQYVAPTMQFLIGLAYGEPFTAISAASFALIWAGLGLFSWDGWRRSRGA